MDAREIEKDKMEVDLNSCIKDFMCSGNHNKFSEYLQVYSADSSKRFQELLIGYLQRKGVKQSELNFIFKDYIWHNITFDGEGQKEPKSNNNEMCTDEIKSKEKKEKVYYDSSMISKWKKGESIPPREVIIQIGIIFRLSLEEVNELLYLCRKYTLYEPILSDYVATFFLRKYSKNKNEEEVFDCEKAKTRIKEVKLKYNEVAKIVRSQKWDQVIDTEHASNILFTNEVKVESDDINLAYLSSNKHKNDDIYNIKTNIVNSISVKPLSEEEYFSCENLKKLYKSHFGFNIMTQKFFSNKNYFKLQYEDTYEPKRNVNKKELLKERKVKSEKDMRKDDIGMTIQFINNTYNKIVDKSKWTLWRERNWSDGNYYTAKMLGGTMLSYDDIGRVDSQRKTDSLFSEYHEKIDAQNLALLTGNEDALQDYMLLGGFWPRKLYYCGDMKKTHEAISDGKIHKEDMTLVYALACKECLIGTWNNEFQLSFYERVRILKEFPFMDLYKEIKKLV
ncbi:MAG: hypothetical protein IJZ00_05680 [Lachnospiraceae bacterium]|nr:hypothetical protein [Lachnospiraceae bacterium]